MKNSLDKNYLSEKAIALLSFLLIMAQIIIVTTCTAMAKKTQTISSEQAKEFKMTMKETHTDTITHAHPGIPNIDYKLNEQLKNMKIQKGASYKPRTKHIDKNGWALYTNRLFLESSPYLLQHAHNPVNWYPWGDTAFKTAKEKGLPILLSIGYSTCHWCHVMEEESFEDIEIATYINENFIAIKVDREERPDVDAVYMSAVQAITGRGGWPMTVWLTPDRRPFYGGTYFPARDGDRGVSIGFLTLLQKIKESYVQKPALIHKTSMDLTKNLQKMLMPEKGGTVPDASALWTVISQIKMRYDKINGGVTGAPKFPSTMPVRLLLRHYRRTLDEQTLEMARYSLVKMSHGGIYDQVGGGFHRYATDEKWLVPHFEKMLYDNALLVMAYLEGFQVTGDTTFKRIVDETLSYVKRDMTAPGGGFYSATDADSLTSDGENEEGYYFTWTIGELEAILGKEAAARMALYFNVSKSGNFEGRNILNITKSAKTIANDIGIPKKVFEQLILDTKSKLYAQRNKRKKPLRDEKILTAWNGLMISAFARSGLLLGNKEYIQIAKKAALFILNNLYINGELFRSYKDGRASHKAYLNDYAFFISALIDLFEADSDPFWFETALALDKYLARHFEDKVDGGFFMTADNHEAMIAREKPGYDGALPSGNAIALMNLFRFYEFTTIDTYRKRAAASFIAFSRIFESSPLALTEMMMALDFSLDTPKAIVIVSPRGRLMDSTPFLKELRNTYLPNRVLIQVEEGEKAKKLARIIPISTGKTAIGGKATAYVCEKGICRLPAHTPDDFAIQIKRVDTLQKTIKKPI